MLTRAPLQWQGSRGTLTALTSVFPLLNPVHWTESQSCLLKRRTFIAVIAFHLQALVVFVVPRVASSRLIRRWKPHIDSSCLNIISRNLAHTGKLPISQERDRGSRPLVFRASRRFVARLHKR